MKNKTTYLLKKITAPACPAPGPRHLTAVFILAAFLLILAVPPAAHAATITVNGTTCTLSQAITAANTDSPIGGCTAGAGADTLDLQTDVTLSAHLPFITSVIIIEGNGFTLDGANSFQVLRVLSTGDLTLNNITITGGNAPIGAAIGNLGDTTLNGTTINNNTAANGGAIYNEVGTLTLNHSTISGNSASDSGGGIVNNFGSLTTLNYSTVTDNFAISGGGIVNNNSSSLNLNRSIISGNSATFGDEIRSINSSAVNANNFNLLGDNANTNGQAFLGFTPCSGGGCTDITATSDGTNPTPLGNILVPTLADNGGPTHTHALLPGSPAVDQIAIDGVVCNPPNTIDQRGAARADGPGAGGTACDIGAAELSSETPTAVFFHTTSAKDIQLTGLLAALFLGMTALTLAFWRRLRPQPIYQSSAGD